MAYKTKSKKAKEKREKFREFDERMDMPWENYGGETTSKEKFTDKY